jgi:hypothetical protein
MVILYSEKNIESMEKNIDGIVLKAIRQQLELLEPPIDEYLKVSKYVMSFIKKHKLIIHGNFAIDTLIKYKNKDDGYFLKLGDDVLLNPNRPSEYPIIDVYSTDPHNAMKTICDELNDKNLKFVEGIGGRANGSYRVLVNFLSYLMISYMPENIYNSVKRIKIDGIDYVDPRILLINNLKIYTSLLINNKLLKDYILTTNKLLKYYPLLLKEDKLIKDKLGDDVNDKLDIIRKKILPNSDLIVFGYYAYYYFMYKGLDDHKKDLYIPYYEVLSNNFKEDVVKIKKELTDEVTVVEHHPFMDYLGESVHFYHKKRLLMIIYNQDKECIQYRSISKKKIFICSYQSFIMTCLINGIMSTMSKDATQQNNYNYMIKNVIDVRNKYLDSNNKTLLDDTPFQEFNVECKGDTITNDRVFRLFVMDKISKREPFMIKYDPDNPDKRYNDKLYVLHDISGKSKQIV